MTNRLEARFVEEIPETLLEGAIYVSALYSTASHLCACGCGSRVVTPLARERWTLTFDGETTLSPSIGNGQLTCGSHYVLRRGRIVWYDRMSAMSAARTMDADRALIQRSYEHYSGPMRVLVHLLGAGWRRIKGVIHGRR